ncbi:MAG: hypothetical protein ABIJ00_00560 [Candidatus Eisenbacteria bacterium]
MKTLICLFVTGTLLMSAHRALCHDGRGGLTLEPQVSTRGLSMGETGLVGTGDAESFAVNPSCLPLAATLQAGLAHGNLIDGVASSATCFSIAFPFGTSEGNPGSNAIRHKYGLGFSFDHKGFDLAQGSRWSCQTVSLGFGYMFSQYASAGIVSKTLFSSSDLDAVGVKAYGIDVGTRLELSPRIDLGLVIRNLVGGATWDGGENEAVPMVVNLGGTVMIPYDMSAELALVVAGSGGSKLGLGLDVPVMETGFHLRGGYAYRAGDYSRSLLTAGFGFRHQRYRLAYAVRVGDENAFGLTHHFSLSGELR